MNYYARPEMSNSKFTLLKESPEAFERQYIDGFSDGPSDAMEFGSLVHCISLEPSKVQERYFVMTKTDRRTKEGKQQYAEQMEAAKGRTLVDGDTLLTANCCDSALRSNPSIRRILETCNESNVEQEMFGRFNGVPVKAKLDYLNLDAKLIFDIKTTQDASPEAFSKSVATFGYHRQAAFYIDLVEQVHNVKCRMVFGVVTKAFPYVAACYELDSYAVDIGRIEIESLCEEYKRRVAANDWKSSFCVGVNQVSLPNWYARSM